MPGVFLLILGAACVGKFTGALAGGMAAGVRGREAVAVGVLMNTRGLIEIVLLTVGRDAGLIDDRLFTLFALMAIVTTLATAPILRRTAAARRVAGRGRGAPARRWSDRRSSAVNRSTVHRAQDMFAPMLAVILLALALLLAPARPWPPPPPRLRRARRRDGDVVQRLARRRRRRLRQGRRGDPRRPTPTSSGCRRRRGTRGGSRRRSAGRTGATGCTSSRATR